jgi:hypothetical protein
MWPILLLLVVVALIGWIWLMNARPARCPLCQRINIWRRKRTGRNRDERDEEGTLLRCGTEFVCGRRQGRYWIVWDDFAGCQAEVSSGPDPR